MDALIQLVLLSMCAVSRSEPLVAALGRHNAERDSFGGDYRHGQESYAFAAIPLHSPLPVLQILSPVPLTVPSSRRRPTAAASLHRPVHVRPQPEPEYFGSSSDYDIIYESQAPESTKYSYSASYSRPQYQPAESGDAEEAPTVLYARPAPQGGYVYRRPQSAGAARTPPKKQPKKESPVILRIHKYKMVKGDR